MQISVEVHVKLPEVKKFTVPSVRNVVMTVIIENYFVIIYTTELEILNCGENITKVTYLKKVLITNIRLKIHSPYIYEASKKFYKTELNSFCEFNFFRDIH